MRQNTDDLWKAVHMTDVDKLQSFHLIIKTCINEQQNLPERTSQFKKIKKFTTALGFSVKHQPTM